MHVLSIAPCFSTTGVSVHVEQINTRLLATGHSVTWAPLSVEEPRTEQCWGEQRVVYPVELPAGPENWFHEKLALADAYVEALLQMQFPTPVDLIHSHDWLAALVGRRLGEHLGCPHLTTVHTLAEIQRRRVGLPGRLPAHRGQIALERELCRASEFIVTVGEAIKELVLEIGELSPEQVEVIPNGVDQKRFSPPPPATIAALRKRLAPNGEQLVLFVGRLAPQKGLDFLLRSTYLVRREHPATRWVLVGDHVAAHMMKPVYEQVMRDGGTRDHLSFEGHVSWDDVQTYYHAADCVVLPSLFESCPYVALEAMATGTCVVASDLDSLRELFVDGVSGLLVPPEKSGPVRGPSVNALAKAQIKVLTDAGLRRRLAEAAASALAQRFTLDRQLATMGDLYARILV